MLAGREMMHSNAMSDCSVHAGPHGRVGRADLRRRSRNPADPDVPRFFPLGAVPIGLSLWGIAIWLLL